MKFKSSPIGKIRQLRAKKARKDRLAQDLTRQRHLSSLKFVATKHAEKKKLSGQDTEILGKHTPTSNKPVSTGEVQRNQPFSSREEDRRWGGMGGDLDRY